MMAIARAAGSRSRDATTRVGAVVAGPDWRVLGTGYNGGPRGSLESLPNAGSVRHAFTIHAEVNALLQAIDARSLDLSRCTLFSTHAPCGSCIRLAAHLGICSIIWDVFELDEAQNAEASLVAETLHIDVRALNDA